MLLRALVVASFLLSSFVCPAAPPTQNSLHFRLQDNLILVPIVLDGHTVDAVLDSGTGDVGIDRTFAASLGLKAGQSIGIVPGGGKPEPTYPVTLQKLDFGPEHLTHLPAFALDLSQISSSAGFPVNVLLGRPVFEGHVLRIDYPVRTIVILPEDDRPACAHPIPFTFYGGDPMIAVTLRATATSRPQILHLIVDLGTRHYPAMIGGAFLNTPGGQALQKASHRSQVGAGTGGIIMGREVTVDDLRVGSQHFPSLTVALTSHVIAFQSGVADGSLGAPLWNNGVITFDYPHRTVCMDLPQGKK